MNLPICVDEIMTFLQIKPGQTGLDATLGYGGHTLEILKRIGHKGRLYATDVDGLQLPKTKERLESLGYGPEILVTKHMNFSDIDKLVSESGPFDFILADLGVSSMQIDNPERGFSFKAEGPLDLRLNPETGKTAASRLSHMTKDEIAGMLIENADEPHAEVIARAVFSHIKKGQPIQTTTQLRNVITLALKPNQQLTDEDIKKSCQRCFQALRIDINSEYEVLSTFLEKLPYALKDGGRAAILSFHSGEDRLVKKSFKQFFQEGIYQEISDGPLRPSQEECQTNSRARSAKLRWAIKNSITY